MAWVADQLALDYPDVCGGFDLSLCRSVSAASQTQHVIVVPTSGWHQAGRRIVFVSYPDSLYAAGARASFLNHAENIQ